MTDKQSQHKLKKDLETKLGRRISDTEWNTYQSTGQEPKPRTGITMDPDKAADLEKRQAIAREKLARIKARGNR